MLHVTCAVIKYNGKILICQRSERMKLPLKWELPGGKIEAGESKEDCLLREIKEELGLEVKVNKALPAVKHTYPDFEITLYPFECQWLNGKLILTEHAQALWVDKDELGDYDWAEADIPIVQELIQSRG